MKISRSKVAFAVILLCCIPLYFSFINSKEEPYPVHQDQEFIEQTERLITELSRKKKLVSKPTEQAIELNQTEPLPFVSYEEKLSSGKRSQVPNDDIQASELVPAWEKELEGFLNGNSTPEKFLDSLNIKNWEHARDELAIAYEENRLPTRKKFQEKF